MPARKPVNISLLLLVFFIAALSTLLTPAAVAAIPKIGPPPGAQPFPTELQARLGETLARLARQGYQPRTHHLRPDGSPEYSNRLLLESSPYLLQHAHNPVNWYPWGDEAFAAARRLNRPVLLSVGYSTCHWCHVMERESFEDKEIARMINQHYIAIKVDREERPDVDSIYMTTVQLLTGRGGWPMTVWLLPNRQPFYGATYLPPHDGDRGIEYGFLSLLEILQQKYRDDPEEITGYGRQLAEALQKVMAPAADGTMPTAELHGTAADYYRERFDPFYGGLDGNPKFPSSLPIRFLLRYHRRSNDKEFLKMAALTLEKMAAGGLNDQIGGGFHRYSVDHEWLVPHFEKMLYDNAQLVPVYLEAYQATGRDDFAGIARSILDYVAREMSAAEGGFYSATDADSRNPEGHFEEGWFFTWTAQEIDAVLGEPQARLVKAFYNVTRAGNFEGRNILHRTRSLEEVAKALELQPTAARELLAAAQQQLYRHRAGRPAPPRDDKILTSWNGLMISAFATAGFVLDDAEYIERAARAADFILNHMRENGRLRRSYKDGQARHTAYLDDYAFLIAGLLDLYEASAEPRWLREALALQKTLDKHYADEQNGGYFLTSDDHEELLVREKPAYDSAEPAGNSVSALNLLRFYEFTTDYSYRAAAERLLASFGDLITRFPSNFSVMLLAHDYYLDKAKEIVIVTPSSAAEAEPFLAELRRRFLPNRVLIVAVQGQSLERQVRLIPLLEGKVAANGKATAYVCEQGVCQLPATDVATFLSQL